MYDSFIDVESRCPVCGRKLRSDWQTKILDCFLETWRKGDFFQYRKLASVPESERKYPLHLFKRLDIPVSTLPIIQNGQVPIHTYCDKCKSWLEGFAIIGEGHFKKIEVSVTDSATRTRR